LDRQRIRGTRPINGQITTSGEQEDFRTRFDWLPNHDDVVLTVRETAHGLKVLYASGHLLEYAVFDLAEIALAKANDYRIAFDRGGVAATMQGITITRDAITYTPDNLRPPQLRVESCGQNRTIIIYPAP